MDQHYPSTIRHQSLHRALDELVACWLKETGQSLADHSILDLVQWSHQQTYTAICSLQTITLDDDLPF